MKGFKSVFGGRDVLITGGAGFIGSNLAHELVGLGASVEVLDNLTPVQGGNVHNLDGIMDKIRLGIADIRDADVAAKAVEGKDFIFNMASLTRHVGSVIDPMSDLDVNCRGSLTLLEACRNHNPSVKVVYAGSRSQYGKIEYNPVDEKHPMNSADPNGVSKAAAEKYHILFYRMYGIRTTSLRLTNTYGPRQQMKDPDLGFVNWFIRLAMDGGVIKIFDGGQTKRDLNYVSDVVTALLMAASDERSNGEAFNVGSGVPVSILDLTKMIIKKVGSGSFEMVPYPKERKNIEIGDYFADIGKVKRMLGWSPATPIDEGLEKTIDFYRKNYW